MNLFLRPIVLWISRPLGFFLLFGVGFLLNAVALAIASWLLPGFELNGILTTIIASIIIAAVNVVIASVLNLGDEDYLLPETHRDAGGSNAISDGR